MKLPRHSLTKAIFSHWFKYTWWRYSEIISSFFHCYDNNWWRQQIYMITLSLVTMPDEDNIIFICYGYNWWRYSKNYIITLTCYNFTCWRYNKITSFFHYNWWSYNKILSSLFPLLPHLMKIWQNNTIILSFVATTLDEDVANLCHCMIEELSFCAPT